MILKRTAIGAAIICLILSMLIQPCFVYAADDVEGHVEVNAGETKEVGNVTFGGPDSYIYSAVAIYPNNGLVSKLTAGKVTYNGNKNGGGAGVYISLANEASEEDAWSTADVTINGGIDAKGNGFHTYTDDNSTNHGERTKVKGIVNGDINATNNAVCLYSYSDHNIQDLTVNGNVSGGNCSITYNDEAKADVHFTTHVTGDAVSRGGNDGLDCYMLGSGSTGKITIDGNVTHTGSYLRTRSGRGSSSEIEIGGDVNLPGSGGALFLDAAGFDGFPGGNCRINIGGKVISNGSGFTSLVDSAGVENYTIEGTAAKGMEVKELAFKADTNGSSKTSGSLTLDSGDTVVSEKNGIYISARSRSNVHIGIDGDLSCGARGIEANETSGGAVVDVIITGTLSAGEGRQDAPIVTYKDSHGSLYGKDLDLTVWEIRKNKDGKIVKTSIYGDGDPYELGEILEKKINYIIKVGQPEEGDLLYLTDADGNDLEAREYNNKTYELAKQDDKVYLHAKKGYGIKAAYNGKDEKVPLEKDENGEYYIVVPQGGGVYLTADCVKLYDVTFKNYDGKVLQTVKAEAGEMPVYTGKTPTKPETAKAAYTFTGWTPKLKAVDGNATYTATFKETAKAGPAPEEKGKDGTAVGEGASAAAADKAITSMKNDSDPKGSVFSKLRLRSPKQTSKSIKLSWTKNSKAVKYIIYGNKCGKTIKPKKLAEVKGKNTKVFKKVAGKKVKKGTYYKFIIVALDKDNKVVSTSKLIHVATKGGKVGNHKSVTVKKSVINKAKKLKKGKTLKLKAKAVAQSKKLKVKKHVAVRYESTNKKVATVSKEGVVKAKKKGKCCIYAFAQSGVYKKIKIVVK